MTSPRTVLVDLRVAQINGDRGIPSYLQSLTLELSRSHPRHRWLLLHDPLRPLPSRAKELGHHATWHTISDLDGPSSSPIDVLLTGCFFFVPHEGGTIDGLLPPAVRRHQPKRLGIVYDLIPLLFPERYLAKARVRRRYFDALQVLRGSDHLFAISHATRHDTIRHAAIDPRRVHCVYGDIDQTKQSLMARPRAETAGVPARHGLTGRYCAYVGGDDWRKNLAGAIKAFALFWKSHPGYQLAIVCRMASDRMASLHDLAVAEGLPRGSVVCTGFVPDDELIGLVRHADMVVFPSLYEGLGLPVLEAYGCQTPVVGSNTSSVAELVLPELAFDPSSSTAMAAAMERLVADDRLREASLALGRRLAAEELGWARAADKVMEHVEGPTSERRTRRPTSPATTARPRVAVVAAFDGSPSGACMTHPSWLATWYDADPVLQRRGAPSRPHDNSVVPIEVLPAALLRARHDAVVFVAGTPFHATRVCEAAIRSRGTSPRRLLWLREATLDGVMAGWYTTVSGTRATDNPTEVGLRLLVDRGEFDVIGVDSNTGRDRIHTALGPRAEGVIVIVAANPGDLDVLLPIAPETGRAADRAHGAA